MGYAGPSGVQLDRLVVTSTVKFHAVGYAGYGPRENRTEPMRYVFSYAANGRDLDLNEK